MTKATDFEVIGAYAYEGYSPDPNTHIGPIICEPIYGGVRHWYCMACDASVNPPADSKARLANDRDKCGR